ncbi:MAG: hypothetical protein ACOZAJ_04735 [Patescibacteria group bacterium]
MKKTAVIITSLVLGLGFVYTALAASPSINQSLSARGPGQQIMLDAKAKLLGLTSEALKTKLESGLNFEQIAAQQNISLADWQAKMKTYQQEKLQQMVANGTITQAQADARLKQMESRQQNHPNNEPFNKGLKKGLRFGRGLGLGLNR